MKRLKNPSHFSRDGSILTVGRASVTWLIKKKRKSWGYVGSFQRVLRNTFHLRIKISYRGSQNVKVGVRNGVILTGFTVMIIHASVHPFLYTSFIFSVISPGVIHLSAPLFKPDWLKGNLFFFSLLNSRPLRFIIQHTTVTCRHGISSNCLPCQSSWTFTEISFSALNFRPMVWHNLWLVFFISRFYLFNGFLYC